jgi:hypothetical protein
MASYIIVCSEVRSTIEGVKTCFRLSFSGVLEYPGGELNINNFFRPFASKNVEKLQTNINGYELSNYPVNILLNILLIATFLYKNDSIELRYSDYEDSNSFQFLSPFRRFQV